MRLRILRFSSTKGRVHAIIKSGFDPRKQRRRIPIKLFPQEINITRLYSIMNFGPENQPEDEWRSFGAPYSYELIYS